jgi:hypothetical protein
MAKLTHEQHVELARLLNQSADNLKAASNIVRRAAFADRTLYVGGTIQEWLIDPLREDFGRYSRSDNPYQSVGYGGAYRRKRPPAKPCVPRGTDE